MTNTSKINFTAVRSCENGQMTAIILGWNPDRWNDWNYAGRRRARGRDRAAP